MAEQHDRWLQGLGIDVESFMAATPAGAGPGYRPPYPGERERGRAEPLASPAQARRNGGTADQGRDRKARQPEGGDEFLSGEFEIGEDGLTGKGALSKSTSADGAVTETVGELEITPTKRAVTGAKREVDFNKAAGGLLPDNVVAKGDGAAGTASAEASINDDSISVGAQANVGETSLTLGTSGTKRDDGSNSDLDQTFRFGLSDGVGLAGRVHFGDADKDGNPEIGVGADFGVVSFDVKSEDPLRTGLGLITAAQGPIGLLPATFGPGGTLDDENLTKKVGDPNAGVEAGRDFGGAAQQGVTEIVDDAKEVLIEGVTSLLPGDDD